MSGVVCIGLIPRGSICGRGFEVLFTRYEEGKFGVVFL